jgi:hypothetical protein
VKLVIVRMIMCGHSFSLAHSGGMASSSLCNNFVPSFRSRRTARALVRRIVVGDAAAVWRRHPLPLGRGEEGERRIHQPEGAESLPPGGEVVGAIAEALDPLWMLNEGAFQPPGAVGIEGPFKADD